MVDLHVLFPLVLALAGLAFLWDTKRPKEGSNPRRVPGQFPFVNPAHRVRKHSKDTTMTYQDSHVIDLQKLGEACGDDASKWAEAFVRAYGVHEFDINHVEMTCWFGGVIQAAKHKGTKAPAEGGDPNMFMPELGRPAVVTFRNKVLKRHSVQLAVRTGRDDFYTWQAADDDMGFNRDVWVALHWYYPAEGDPNPLQTHALATHHNTNPEGNYAPLGRHSPTTREAVLRYHKASQAVEAWTGTEWRDASHHSTVYQHLIYRAKPAAHIQYAGGHKIEGYQSDR